MQKIIKATKPIFPDYNDYINEIADIWNTESMTNNGSKLQKFTLMLKEYMRCKNTDVFVNGHSALLTAIYASELKGEVLTSPFTFISTTNSIIQNNLTPVFCDIDDTYNIDTKKLENYITKETSAIIVPHIFGIPCDVNEINRIASKYNLKVIYDAAQAFGTKFNGVHIGNFGDVSMFSLHAIKVFNSIEGGLLTYHDAKLHKKLELLRNFGILYKENTSDVVLPGINAKMNEFQAAMGILNLKLVDNEIRNRRELAQIYINCLNEIKGIATYPYKNNIDYNYAYFPIRIKKEYGMNRNELWEKLKEKQIFTRKLYDVLTCDFSYYKNRNYITDVNYAREVSNETLDLPIYSSLKKDDIYYICSIIKKLGKGEKCD